MSYSGGQVCWGQFNKFLLYHIVKDFTHEKQSGSKNLIDL